MKQEIQKTMQNLKRSVALIMAVLMVSTAAPSVVFAAAAGGQMQERSVRLSDSAPSDGAVVTGVGSGTNVTYRVTFKAGSSYTIRGVVLDFCAGDGGTPFINDTNCPIPPGFTVGTTPAISTADYTVNSVTTAGLGSGWTAADTTASSGQIFKMANATGTALTSGTTYTFAITGVTNPDITEIGTFYARLITYTAATGDIDSYDHDAVGSYQDYGGFALSTAQPVQVTARVQESLTFCVAGSEAAPPTITAPTSCDPLTNNLNVPAITLGHIAGSSATPILDAQNVDTNSIFSVASTNALNGLSIRMRSGNSCGGLSADGGTTCDIPGAGAGTGVAAAIAAGTAAFGMFCNDGTGGDGTIPCDTNYNDGVNNTSGNYYYGFDSTSPEGNVLSDFGDVIAASTAPVNNVVNRYDFAATASNTTPAGIYTANLAMIATGTF